MRSASFLFMLLSVTAVAPLQVQQPANPFAVERSPGVMTIVRWISPRMLETVAKKDGTVAATGTYEVSADGKILTARMVTPDFEQVVVFERR